MWDSPFKIVSHMEIKQKKKENKNWTPHPKTNHHNNKNTIYKSAPLEIP